MYTCVYPASHLQTSRRKAVIICVPQPLAFRNTSHSEPSFCITHPNCRLQTLAIEYVIIQLLKWLPRKLNFYSSIGRNYDTIMFKILLYILESYIWVFKCLRKPPSYYRRSEIKYKNGRWRAAFGNWLSYLSIYFLKQHPRPSAHLVPDVAYNWHSLLKETKALWEITDYTWTRY